MARLRMTAATGVALLALVALSGCFSPGSGPLQLPPEPDASSTGGPQDWTSLPHCDNGPPDPWVLVDDFPVELIESAGLQGECGDTYLTPDLPPYVSIADSNVSLEELEALAAALESAGYRLTGDSFEPKTDADPPDTAGTWEYTLEGSTPDDVTLVYVVNFWSGGPRSSYFTYIDFESPSTRVFG
jgi:hypothetical protein